MKVCNCGASKWKKAIFKTTNLVVLFECLKCYKKYPLSKLKRLKDRD